MKKILSVALSTAMAFSMFASVAFGQAGLTDVNAQYNYLKDKGIFNGYPDGQAHLDKSMTRAEFAKVITKTLGLKEVTGVYSYNDKNYGANHWAAPYVEAVTAEGIMEGKNTTKKLFDLSGAVTVQEMATVLVRALDLEIPKETNNTASAWAKGYVQAAINAGLVKADANFQSNASRELLVGAAYAVDQKVAVSVKSYTVSEAGKVVEFTMNDGKTVKVTLDKALEANKVTPVKFTYNGKEFTHNVTYVVTNLKVESVSAINGKELVVKFNVPVDKSSVITTGTPDTVKTGVVTVTRTSTDSHTSDVAATLSDANTKATLSEDGTTLTITAGKNKFFKGNYDVKVADAVKKDTLDKMENFYGKFTANDIVGPTVTAVKYNVASDKFEVTLSEPIDEKTGEVLRVNGQPVTSGFDTVSAPTTKLTVARPADVQLGTTASIYIAGLKDASGNLMTAYTGNVDVTQDTSALAVSEIKQVSNNVVRVTFNKKLDTASNSKITGAVSSNGLVVTKSDGTVTTNYTVAATAVANNPDGNKYDITLTDATYANGDKENFAITLTDKAFKGVSGTANSVVTQNITLTKDTVKPTVKSSKVSIDNEAIEVVLDKAISSSITSAKVKLRRNGAELTAVTAELKAGTDNVLVVKTTDSTAVTGNKLNAGTYQVRLEAGAVTDLNGNSNDIVNAPTVTVGDSSTIDPAKAVIANGGSANEFKVTAPGTEKFTTASLNYKNFVLDGNTIPANSDITLDTARKVITVKLPEENSVNIAGSALLTASGLSFESGNPYATSSATVTVADNTSATLTSSALLGNTLELTFDEAINASTLTNLADILGDLVISSSAGTFADTNSDAEATVVSGSSNKKIVITIKPGTSNWATVIAGSDLTVSTKQATTTGKVSKLKDANGVLVKAPVKVSVTK